MGCDEAVLIQETGVEAIDTLGTARILAAAAGRMESIQLVFFGKSSVDSATGVTFAQTARLLGWPLLSLVASISALDPSGPVITVERLLPEGREVVKASLPAVVSVVKEINEPRYPSFMGIRKASKAEIPVWGMAELGLDSPPAPKVAWPALMPVTREQTKCEMVEGATPSEAAARLAGRLLEEKVI